MADDDRLKLSIKSIVKKRRVKGKTLLVFEPTGESVRSITELWGKIKHDKELYDKVMKDAALKLEKEDDFDARAIKSLLSREFDEEVENEGMNIEEEIAVKTCSEARFKVTVGNFPKKSSLDDFESFLKQFDGVEKVKQEVFLKKGSSVKVFKGSYEVTFNDSDSAAKFFSLPAVRFGKQKLTKRLLYSCCYCARIFLYEHMLRQHISSSHIKRSFQCHACPKKFARQDHFENHKLLHKDSVPFCITCKKKFKSNLALFKHLKNGAYCSLQCILCTKTFVKKCNLDKHVKVCHGHKDDLGGTCEICMRTFKYSIDLERHRKLSTSIDGSFEFVCGYCEKKFCSFDNLQDHIQSDSKVCHRSQKKTFVCERVYPCENCGKQFPSQDLMVTHLETHTDNIKARTKTKHNVAQSCHEFTCNPCGKKFKQYKNYDRHKRQAYNHDETPQNVCDKCDKCFCTSRLLKRHMNTSHVASCTTCDETFSTKRALNHHIMKKESVTCSECNKVFCNKKAFCVHMSFVHFKFVK